ncbi:MAG: enolase C-terminal domain-like protein [Acidimicrobiia bacterium]|nr:enolase C-terminal domain-like protein [Acidimicrobiia bacterium]
MEVYASSVFLEERDADGHQELLAPVLARGVNKVKLRVGPEWRRDLVTLAELRSRLGDGIELMIDGSEIFTLPTALEVAKGLADLGVVWFEEPLPQGARAGIEELVRHSPVPIAYGEHLYGRDDAVEELRQRRLSILQPDAATCGGISEARQVGLVAASFGARVVPHVCAGPIALAANLHLAATIPRCVPSSIPTRWPPPGTGSATVLRSVSMRSGTGPCRFLTSPGSGSPSTRAQPATTPTVRRAGASQAPAKACPTASSAIADQPHATSQPPRHRRSSHMSSYTGEIGRSMAEFSSDYMTYIEGHLDEDLEQVPERILGLLRSMEDLVQGFAVDQLEHSLQTATRAERGGADLDMIVASLCHDIGKTISNANHPAMAAEMIRPWVSDEAYWVVKYHQDFQGRHYYGRIGLDPEMRSKHEGIPTTRWPLASLTSGTRPPSTPTMTPCLSSTSSQWCARCSPGHHVAGSERAAISVAASAEHVADDRQP